MAVQLAITSSHPARLRPKRRKTRRRRRRARVPLRLVLLKIRAQRRAFRRDPLRQKRIRPVHPVHRLRQTPVGRTEHGPGSFARFCPVFFSRLLFSANPRHASARGKKPMTQGPQQVTRFASAVARPGQWPAAALHRVTLPSMKFPPRLRAGLAALAALAAGAASAFAAGTLLPTDAPHAPLQIRVHQVNVTRNNGFAQTAVLQTFSRGSLSPSPPRRWSSRSSPARRGTAMRPRGAGPR